MREILVEAAISGQYRLQGAGDERLNEDSRVFLTLNVEHDDGFALLVASENFGLSLLICTSFIIVAVMPATRRKTPHDPQDKGDMQRRRSRLNTPSL